MKAKTVLVIDDDEMNLQIAKMILEKKLACNVLTADNGLDGIEILRSQKVNLILLDVMMPNFDGIETLTEIRKDDKIKDVPVIMLTASGDIEVIQKVNELGVKNYIKKPFIPAELVSRVEKKFAEEPKRTEVLLIGNDEKILNEMQKIIEEKFNHEVIKATNVEEISDVEEVNLIISDAEIKFIDGVKFLNRIASNKKFDHVPFVVTTADKLVELFNSSVLPKDNVENSLSNETADSEVINKDKKRLAKVVTNFIGYELDLHI